jgi:hypothetical protein
MPEKKSASPRAPIENWPLPNARRDRLKTVRRRLIGRSCGQRDHVKGAPLPDGATPLKPRELRKLERLKLEENRIIGDLTRPTPDTREELAEEISCSILFLKSMKNANIAGLNERSREFWRRADRLGISNLPPLSSSQAKTTVVEVEEFQHELRRAVEALASHCATNGGTLKREKTTWKQAKDFLIAYCKTSVFPGVNVAAEIIESRTGRSCSSATVRKAIKKSVTLKNRQTEAKVRNMASVTDVALTEVSAAGVHSSESDPTQQPIYDSQDDLLAWLKAKSTPDEWKKFEKETPQKREKIMRLALEQRGDGEQVRGRGARKAR